MQLDLSLDLPDPLYQELLNAALECRVSPKIFASQAVEVVLAGRRLESIPSGRCGPRIGKADFHE